MTTSDQQTKCNESQASCKAYCTYVYEGIKNDNPAYYDSFWVPCGNQCTAQWEACKDAIHPMECTPSMSPPGAETPLGPVEVVCAAQECGSVCSGKCAEYGLLCPNVFYKSDHGWGKLCSCKRVLKMGPLGLTFCTFHMDDGAVCTVTPHFAICV
jgi:hypothetical protein